MHAMGFQLVERIGYRDTATATLTLAPADSELRARNGAPRENLAALPHDTDRLSLGVEYRCTER